MRGHGAAEDEIKEATRMAAMVRMGSTLVNGVQPETETFRYEVDRMAHHAKTHAAGAEARAVEELTAKNGNVTRAG